MTRVGQLRLGRRQAERVVRHDEASCGRGRARPTLSLSPGLAVGTGRPRNLHPWKIPHEVVDAAQRLELVEGDLHLGTPDRYMPGPGTRWWAWAA